MDKEEYKCNTCLKVYKTAAGLKAHTTNKKVPCKPPPPELPKPAPAPSSPNKPVPQRQVPVRQNTQPVQTQPVQSKNNGFDTKAFNDAMMALQQRQQQQQQPQQQQQLARQPQDGMVITNAKTFINGKEMPQYRPDYNPMKDTSIPFEERYQRLVAKIVNDVTTEDNGRYANLGDPKNLGILTDRLNRETGNMCMANANNNGRPIMPMMPPRTKDELIADLHLRKMLSEAAEELRKEERERVIEAERRERKEILKKKYTEAEKQRAYLAETYEEERQIMVDVIFNTVCHFLSIFTMTDISDLDTNEQQSLLDKKILYMKRKAFFVNNLKDVVNKILLGELEYEMKKLDPHSAKYEEVKAKYDKEKAIFANIMDNEKKLDYVIRDRLYNRIFENLLKMLVDGVRDRDLETHNELLMSVAKIRNDLELYLYDHRNRIDEILRMVMCYDNEKYKQLQTIIFSNLHLGDNTSSTMEILDNEEDIEIKVEKEKEQNKHEFPTVEDAA